MRTIEVDDAFYAQLEAAAGKLGTNVGALVNDLLASALEAARLEEMDWSEDDLAAVDEGLRQARAGQTIPHEEVMAEVRRRLSGEA